MAGQLLDVFTWTLAQDSWLLETRRGLLQRHSHFTCRSRV